MPLLNAKRFSMFDVQFDRVYPSLITLPLNEFPCSEVQSQTNSHHSFGIVKLQERFSASRLKLAPNLLDSVQFPHLLLGATRIKQWSKFSNRVFGEKLWEGAVFPSFIICIRLSLSGKRKIAYKTAEIFLSMTFLSFSRFTAV